MPTEQQQTAWEAEIERLKAENKRLSKKTDYGTYVAGIYPVFGETGAILAVVSFNREHQALRQLLGELVRGVRHVRSAVS